MNHRVAAGEDRDERRPLLIAVVIVFLVIAGVTAYTSLARPPPSGTTVTTSTQFSIGADVVVSTAASQNPSGYTQESAKANATAGGDWAVLGQADGSSANITAMVFASANDSRAYLSSLVSSLRGLPGYTDLSSALSAYQQYGSCYGYGEDVDGIAVANGVCTKGNVFLQVHLVSSKSLGDLEADMASLMGAMYGSVG